MACIYGHLELVKFLISNCTIDIFATRDVLPNNTKASTVAVDPILEHPNCTVFHMVCWLGSEEIAKILIQKGAMVSTTTQVLFS